MDFNLGSILQSGAQSFTPQNNFEAQNPLDLNGFNTQIAQSISNFNQNQSRQLQLAQALQAQSMGQGPNPAQNMLNQATNQNIAQNTGMIASQKGINPALAARLASQNAGTMNQQAAGQAATMNAQQQLGAQSQLGGLYSGMANQNMGMANDLSGQTNTAINGVNQLNAGTSAQNAAANQATTSGLLSGLGSAAMKWGGFAHGGIIPHYASGGQAPMFSNASSQSIANQILAQSGMPQWATGMKLNLSGSDAAQGPSGDLPGTAMAGGPMDAMGIPGAEDIGGAVGPAMMVANRGAVIPGRANVKGDSESNDVVPAMLSPGEIVIPRSKADDPEKAKEFIEHLKGQKNKKDLSYGKVLEAHRKMNEGLEMLKKCMGGSV